MEVWLKLACGNVWICSADLRSIRCNSERLPRLAAFSFLLLAPSIFAESAISALDASTD